MFLLFRVAARQRGRRRQIAILGAPIRDLGAVLGQLVGDRRNRQQRGSIDEPSSIIVVVSSASRGAGARPRRRATAASTEHGGSGD
jgi:hypothetical protein